MKSILRGLLAIAVLTPMLLTAQMPFVRHFLYDSGLTSKFTGFVSSPQGGYFGIAYAGPDAYRDLIVVRFNDQGDTLWSKTYHSPNQNGTINRFPVAADIANDGGLFVLTATLIPQIQYNTVFRLSATGDSLWHTTVSEVVQWAGALYTVIKATPDGGCMIAGRSQGFPSGAKVLKVSANGEIAWASTDFASDYGYNKFNAIAVNQQGEAFLAGMTHNNANGDERLLVAKVNSAGAKQWEHVLFSGNATTGDSIRGFGTAICETVDGGCILGGFATDPGEPGGRALLQKYDAGGNVQWTKKYFRWDYLYQIAKVYDIIPHTNDNFLCLIHQNDGYTTATPTLMKFDQQGDSLWTQLGVDRRWRMAKGDPSNQILLFGDSPHPEYGWWEQAIAVRATTGGVFSPPSNFVPGNFAADVILNPVLEWIIPEHRGGSRLQVATDSLFANLVTDVQNISGISYQCSGLMGNTTYYWRVCLYGFEGGPTAWSNFYRFTTLNNTGSDELSADYSLKINVRLDDGSVDWDFKLQKPAKLKFEVFDPFGRLLISKEAIYNQGGEHRLYMNLPDMCSGIYLFRMSEGMRSITKKLAVR